MNNKAENNFRLMNAKQHPDLLEMIRKWERELNEHAEVKVALIAYEGKK